MFFFFEFFKRWNSYLVAMVCTVQLYLTVLCFTGLCKVLSLTLPMNVIDLSKYNVI